MDISWYSDYIVVGALKQICLHTYC